ncbi:hypothetical protein DENSPDRAFT_856085 [Dentipellis sp. KUC8613]|nr:hypothetical protein DENSPDRAFT_856085 [Dentipellis sp. KUC8613]
MIKASPKLKGFNIPGLQKRVLVSLFADDTALYLSKEDRYDDVKELLDKWCLASGAKFNISKTEIIPIGSQEHRDTIIRTRKINQNDREPLDQNIRIAKDKDATRYLGAWIGNHVDNIGPWETTLETIEANFKMWAKAHPTLNGKSLIVQMNAGGRTQFRAKVQGMPDHVEKELIKIIRNFIWDGKHTPPVAMDQLYRPRAEGGIGLLDIKTRNKAIQITWLRAYLDLSPTRPKWAFITDLLVNKIIPKGFNDVATINTFLQTWNPVLQGKRTNFLGQETINMFKVAKEFNTTFAALKITKDLKEQLPAWYHLGAPKPKTMKH